MAVDEAISLAINGLAGQSAAADYFFLQVGIPKTFYLPGAIAIAYWIWSSWREALLGGPVLAGSVGISDFLGGQLKWAFERVRPCRALPDVVKIEPNGCGALFSFPSNHAINTAAVAAFFQVLYPKSGWISWPIVGLIGFARVYIGAHYVTDVLGGWVIGGAIGGGIAWLLLRWPVFRKKPASNMAQIVSEADARPS